MGTWTCGWIVPGTYTRREFGNGALLWGSSESFFAIICCLRDFPRIQGEGKVAENGCLTSLRQNYLDQVQRVTCAPAQNSQPFTALTRPDGWLPDLMKR